MAIRTKKIFLLLIISFLLGAVLSAKDISMSLSLYESYELNEIQPVIINNIVYIAYSIILIFCLLFINTEWKGKGNKQEAILFIVSLFTALLLYSLANIFTYQDVSEKYFQMYMTKQHHAPHRKIDFLAVRSVYILFIVYIGILIYKLYRKKVETEKTLEKLKTESLQSKLTALSNQINPHFFFNALNSLHSLIIEDKKESSLAYLTTLSNVFRYILRSETKNLVSLKDELAFLAEYKYMLDIKYGNKLTVDCNIEDEKMNYRIPVLSLLPILENVIKHNEISNANHMVVNITVLEDSITIANKIKKRIDPVPSDGTGLVNLNNRYKLLVNKEIIIKQDGEIFSVCLPLIKEQK